MNTIYLTSEKGAPQKVQRSQHVTSEHCHVTSAQSTEQENTLGQKVHHTRSGRDFTKDYSENATTQVSQSHVDEEVVPRQKEDFWYDIIDHLLRVPIKASLLDLIKMDKSVRASLLEMLTEQKYELEPANEIKVSKIQIDLSSTVNILPIQIINHVSLTPRSLKETNVKIHKYDGQGSRALGKIRIKCRIDDLIAYPDFYVVEACTTYGLLLGRPWIHENHVISSMLHQCFKYVDSNLTVRRQFANRKPFHGEGVYCLDAALYKEEARLPASQEE
ncbi:hypothetical protein AAC387_Pa02g1873 [Persea americana]